jgi:hypothetical protein
MKQLDFTIIAKRQEMSIWYDRNAKRSGGCAYKLDRAALRLVQEILAAWQLFLYCGFFHTGFKKTIICLQLDSCMFPLAICLSLDTTSRKGTTFAFDNALLWHLPTLEELPCSRDYFLYLDLLEWRDSI